jgi:hypothetical protein
MKSSIGRTLSGTVSRLPVGRLGTDCRLRRSKIDWLLAILTLPGGVPSHDTFRRVFCLLAPLASRCFSPWMTALMERRGLVPVATDPLGLTPIAIDGKAQRGSKRSAGAP